MKKKYRRAVYYALSTIVLLTFSPLVLMSAIGKAVDWVGERAMLPIIEYLKTKLRVYDTDLD